MNITVKCFATLAQYTPECHDTYPLEAGTTVKGLMDILGLTDEDVKIVMVNGRHSEGDRVLEDGDRVGFFPAVGGG